MSLRRLLVVIAVLASPLPIHAQGDSWQPDPDLIRELTERRPQINYEEARIPEYTLPDPLRADREVVRTPEEWRTRRAEILSLFREHMYGWPAPAPEQLAFEIIAEDPAAMDGAAHLKQVEVVSRQSGREHRFEFVLFLPNRVEGPAPVFLLLNHRPDSNTDPSRAEKSEFWPAEEVIARGYGIAAFQTHQLAPDDKDRFREEIIRFVEGEAIGEPAPDAWGTLAAWAWGGSRVMDYFETDPDVDASRAAVVGHSRGGKAALWTGAEDERFALVISNQSGAGGASLTRRRFGETVAWLNERFPHWFARNFLEYGGREDAMPVDQHMLMSLIAPRGLYVASADEDLWCDPRGEFLSLAHASPVYALSNEPAMDPEAMPPLDQPLVVGSRAYHVRPGGHGLHAQDWGRFMDFADRLWTTEKGSR